ncbi:MAG: sigma-54 dependent transcriptional regulator [Gemmatimonadales bacterium]|nr:sigma-54 dependent transcriptional regulator [Gemmatimonadales bacterium]
MPECVAVIEDDRELRDLLVELLGDAGYRVHGFRGAETALRALAEGLDADAVLTDLMLGGLDGEAVVTRLRATRPELPVLVLTAFGSIESAKQLLRSGAADYLTKPIANEALLDALRVALARATPARATNRTEPGATVVALPGLIGVSPAMEAVARFALRAAPSAHPVLVLGESGTGKELVARALHARSGRSAFVPVNCAALPEPLLESELFGHERGAFTGADRARPGLFEVADGGTLFLDEIGELPLALQPKLLRALDSGEVRRVGAAEARTVDVRVIAATNRDLEQEVAAGRFREDLFWRLNVLACALPPLRERPDDIPALVDAFLPDAGPGARRTLAPEALGLLLAYHWPGNVRELRAVVQRAAVLAEGAVITEADLPERLRQARSVQGLVRGAGERRLPLREVERLYVLDVLARCEGNRSRASQWLGVDRKTLYRWLEGYAQQDGGEGP